jgi:hypothetical protein
MLGNEVTLEFKAKSLFSAIAASSNNTLQLTVKSVAIFAKQKYAPLSPAAELGR